MDHYELPDYARSPEHEKPQKESHRNQHSQLVRDCIIGFADGLTVPFALTAGLTSLGSTKIVVLAGLAELFAGSISMGLGAWLAATTDAKHYKIEEQRERREVKDTPRAEEEEIYEIFGQFGIVRGECRPIVEALKRDENMWVLFMMRFELGLEKPATKGAWLEGLVMGVSYFLGGLLPMIPYFALDDVNHALFISIGITAVILLGFGYIKAVVIGTTRWEAVYSAAQTLLVGSLAAAVSYGIVRGVKSAGTL